MKVAQATVMEISEPGHRLDASYHASLGVKAFRHLEKRSRVQKKLNRPSRYLQERQPPYSEYHLQPLSDVCEKGGIFIPKRFKRVFVTDIEHGAPYLTGSSILKAEPTRDTKLLSFRHTRIIDNLTLQQSMILITCSGTIGNTAYVNADFNGAVGSPDLLRIVADSNKIHSGYLYAFLSSQIGQALIDQKTYGAVIPHIEAHHLFDLPIPRLASSIEDLIHELLEEASSLRVLAIKKKNKSVDLLSIQLGLDSSLGSPPKWTSVPARDLDMRFDGGFHTARVFVEDPLAKTGIDLVPIGSLLQDIFYLGKLHRVFVDDPDYGVPLLSIAEIQRAKIRSDKFISRTRSRNVDKAKLEKGQVLVSRSGTTGIVAYVRDEIIGMAGSDHIIRLVADETKLLPGYLYTFLICPIGQTLLEGATHGSVLLELPPEYVSNIRIPLLPIPEQLQFQHLIDDYSDLLTRASMLENEAQSILLDALGWDE